MFFKQVDHFLFYTITPGEGQIISFMIHNSHFHCQDLNCLLYAQALRQVQEDYQRYTLKDNLDQPSGP